MASNMTCMPWYVLPTTIALFVAICVGLLTTIYCVSHKHHKLVFMKTPCNTSTEQNFVYGNRNSGNSNQIRAAMIDDKHNPLH